MSHQNLHASFHLAFRHLASELTYLLLFHMRLIFQKAFFFGFRQILQFLAL